MMGKALVSSKSREIKREHAPREQTKVLPPREDLRKPRFVQEDAERLEEEKTRLAGDESVLETLGITASGNSALDRIEEGIDQVAVICRELLLRELDGLKERTPALSRYVDRAKSILNGVVQEAMENFIDAVERIEGQMESP